MAFLETHGIRAVCGNLGNFRRGHEDMAVFIAKHRPTVLLFDISVPYASNWDYLAALRLLLDTGVLPFSVTTANKNALDKAVGLNDAIEITATAADFDAVTAAITTAHAF